MRPWLYLGLTCLIACAESDGSVDAGPVSTIRHDLGVSLIEQVLLPRLDRLVVATQAFEAAAQTQADLVAGGTAVDRQGLQTSWLTVMDIVQELEVLQLGAAAPSATRRGGQDLRDEIYSWPVVNPCKVDQVLASGIFVEAGFRPRVRVNVYGLDALEVLLFRVGEFNVCPPQLPINEEGQWEALGAPERERRRYAYAAVIAAGLRADAEQLRAAWTAADGLLVDAKAGGEGSVFDAPEALLGEWIAALLHLDTVSKDKRLALPSGINPDCGRAICSEKLEFRTAAANGLALRANLRAAAAVLGGDGGLGFYDLLRHDGAADLAEQLETAVVKAIATARAIEVTWSELLGSDPEALRNLHTDLAAVTTLLKGPFLTVLNLDVPGEGAGESD